MKKKFKEFCEKPITWGSYFKLCKWSLIGSAIAGLGTAIYFKLDELRWEKELQEREKSMFADSYGSKEDEAN